MKFKFLDHPTDLKIQIFGKDQEELFIHAALGMMTFLYPKYAEIIDHETKEKIRLKARDSKELLIDWLTELIEFSDTKDVCYNDFHFDKLTDDELVAIAYGRRVHAKVDIKSIRQHKVEIKKTQEDWKATIQFDI